jgi:16S rRNA (cytosine1402-N4)-methyltransferase
MGEGHLPVLVDEVVASLAVGPGSSVADCTVGGGGHAERLLEAASPDGRLLGIDADRAAIAEAERVLARFGDRVVLRHANFESIYDVATDAGFVPLDAVLFDLGLSSYQLADPDRGFSFAADAPPDMRFDETSGLSALELIERSSERELAGIIATFGEERRAGRIAKAIVAARAEGRIVTAAELAAIVASVVPSRHGRRRAAHPSGHAHVPGAPHRREPRGRGPLGRPGRRPRGAPPGRADGRHQLPQPRGPHREAVRRAREPRLHRGAPLPPACTCGHRAQLRAVTKGVITPGPEEVRRNRRARSAKLRVAEKLAMDEPKEEGQMSKGRSRHQASRRRMYSARQRELRERRRAPRARSEYWLSDEVAAIEIEEGLDFESPGGLRHRERRRASAA